MGSLAGTGLPGLRLREGCGQLLGTSQSFMRSTCDRMEVFLLEGTLRARAARMRTALQGGTGARGQGWEAERRILRAFGRLRSFPTARFLRADRVQESALLDSPFGGMEAHGRRLVRQIAPTGSAPPPSSPTGVLLSPATSQPWMVCLRARSRGGMEPDGLRWVLGRPQAASTVTELEQHRWRACRMAHW